VEGRKRHLLVDTEGLVLGVRVHSARVPDADGIKLDLGPARERLGRLSHLWVDAGYQGRGKRWAEEAMGLSVEVVRKPPKPLPEEVAERWASPPPSTRPFAPSTCARSTKTVPSSRG
jgi:putative transposase